MTPSSELTDHQVQQLLSVARITARHFWGKRWVHFTNLTEEDLTQIAFIGALKAHRTFRMGGKTYTGWLITHARGELQHALRSPIARFIGIPRVEYEGRRVRSLDYDVLSLDAEFQDSGFSGSKDPRTFSDATADPSAGPDTWPMLRDLLAHLSGRRGQVVFLADVCGQTQDVIGRRLGVSQTHISRLLRAGRKELRMVMEVAS